MKTISTRIKKHSLKLSILCVAALTFVCFGFTTASVSPDKITICHIPPGNPDNCHEITISVSAFETHMDHHNDALVCYNQEEYEFYRILSVKTDMQLRTVFTEGQ